MSNEHVIDTSVLQKANAPITQPLKPDRRFAKRVAILQDIVEGRRIVLCSARLVAEYRDKVKEPRNDFVRAFFAALDDPKRRILNWKRLTGKVRSSARKCRFPRHDYHVLQTAIRPKGSTIISEEQPMLATNACIHREFDVHIVDVA